MVPEPIIKIFCDVLDFDLLKPWITEANGSASAAISEVDFLELYMQSFLVYNLLLKILHDLAKEDLFDLGKFDVCFFTVFTFFAMIYSFAHNSVTNF